MDSKQTMGGLCSSWVRDGSVSSTVTSTKVFPAAHISTRTNAKHIERLRLTSSLGTRWCPPKVVVSPSWRQRCGSRLLARAKQSKLGWHCKVRTQVPAAGTTKTRRVLRLNSRVGYSPPPLAPCPFPYSSPLALKFKLNRCKCFKGSWVVGSKPEGQDPSCSESFCFFLRA